jgi:hypothetical protein
MLCGGSSAWSIQGVSCTSWRDTNFTLDSHCCLVVASMVTKIQDLGIEHSKHSWGCTGLCQLVDVGINKPSRIIFENSGRRGR